MVDVLSLKKDENFALKREVLDQLAKEGTMENLKAQLRS
jgi:FOP N terminal dimerisation domain